MSHASIPPLPQTTSVTRQQEQSNSETVQKSSEAVSQSINRTRDTGHIDSGHEQRASAEDAVDVTTDDTNNKDEDAETEDSEEAFFWRHGSGGRSVEKKRKRLKRGGNNEAKSV